MKRTLMLCGALVFSLAIGCGDSAKIERKQTTTTPGGTTTTTETQKIETTGDNPPPPRP